jgi:hypothetical protein
MAAPTRDPPSPPSAMEDQLRGSEFSTLDGEY